MKQEWCRLFIMEKTIIFINDTTYKLVYNGFGDENVVCDIWDRKIIDGSKITKIEKTVSMFRRIHELFSI